MEKFSINSDSQFELAQKNQEAVRNRWKPRFKKPAQPQLSCQLAPPSRFSSIEFDIRNSSNNSPRQSLKSQPKTPTHPLMVSLRRYRIKRLTDLFVSKLKQSAVLRRTPAELDQQDHVGTNFLERSLGDVEGLETKSIWNNIVQIASMLGIIWLMIVYSLVCVFGELERSEVLAWSRTSTLIILVVQLITNFFVKNTSDGKVINELRNIIIHYTNNGLLFDLLEIVCLIVDMQIQVQYIEWFRLRILFKVPFILREIERIKQMLCINTQRQQQWDLMMVFITNFLFAHLLSVVLNGMTYLDPRNNWWVSHNIANTLWYTRYIYGYYWGTNIMLTVGFGDYVATNEGEALILIFVEMVSCITLAYNINCVGNLMNGLRARDLEKNKNLRTFARMYEESNNFNRDLENRVNHFIVKAFEMKTDFNLEGEAETLSILPIKLKEEFVKGANLHILQNLYFLEQLSMRTLKELALRLQKKITHPEEIIIKKGDKSKLHILYSGSISFFSYQNKRGRSDHTTVQSIEPTFDRTKNCMIYRQISLKEFIRKREESHYVASVNYCVMYCLEQQDFEEVVRLTKIDLEKYCALRDQDSFDQIIEGLECKICNTKQHSKFECPRVHFVPLREIICLKYKHKCDKGETRKPFHRIRQRSSAPFGICRTPQLSAAQSEAVYLTRDVDEKQQNDPTVKSLAEEKSYLLHLEFSETLQNLDKHEIWRNYFPKYNVNFNEIDYE